MDWLKRRARGDRQAKPAVLGDADAIELGAVRDLPLLLAAIDVLRGSGVVLYLEGSHVAPDVQAFLDSRPVPDGRREVARGTIWPRARTFHLPLDEELVAGLRSLADRHATPEMCDHLVVYSGERTLLEAYDAGGGRVWVARDLPDAALTDLRRALSLE